MLSFKEQMEEKIRRYSNEEYLDGYIKDEFLTEDGDADIFLNIKSRDDLIDSRTIDKQLEVVDSVYEFIEKKTSMLSNDIAIHLHIKGLNLNSNDREMIRHIIKEHYAIELYKVQKEYTRLKRKIFHLVLLGIVFLLNYAGLYLFTNFEFFKEIFGFLFSFSLWEAFDCLIYAFSDTKAEREAITQNLLMDIDFDN